MYIYIYIYISNNNNVSVDLWSDVEPRQGFRMTLSRLKTVIVETDAPAFLVVLIPPT